MNNASGFFQDLIDRNAFDFGQQMYEKNARIAQLEEEAEMLRHQADDSSLHAKIHDLQEELSVQTKAATEGTTKTTRFVLLARISGKGREKRILFIGAEVLRHQAGDSLVHIKIHD